MWNANDLLITDIFFALGDKTRLSIIGKLSAGCSLSATRLSDNAKVTRQNIVKHLRILEKAGLVSHQKQGREVLYTLDQARIKEAQQFLDDISVGWDRAIDRLRTSVETE